MWSGGAVGRAGGVEVGGVDDGALVAQESGDLLTDAGAGAGHQRDAIGESGHLSFPQSAK
jgi:hypothetical protein